MKKFTKLLLLSVLVLGLSQIYLGNQVSSLQDRVDRLDYLVIETNITIYNGTEAKSEVLHLTRGATALEALERTSNVETKYYPGVGAMIQGINGVRNNHTTGKYWLIAHLNETSNDWESLQAGAGSFELHEEEKIFSGMVNPRMLLSTFQFKFEVVN